MENYINYQNRYQFKPNCMIDLFSHPKILVTGGTGSWGHELVRQLLEKYPDIEQIRIYSRGEHRQVEMINEFKNNLKLKFIIGDVRDKNILNFAMKDVDIVFHLAALKHVPVCENNPWEAVLTNVYGTQNVMETAIANKVKMVVDVSTDKAVEPFNIYGMTKAVGEKIMVNANFTYSYNHHNETNFICIRGGNVIGTNGSVIPLFKEQLQKNNEITITNPKMTRYLMSTREAIGLIFTAVENSVGAELFVMHMPATSLETIAHVMINLFGNKDSKISIIGERPGEKLNEVLVSKNESPFTRVYSDKYYIILPQLHNEKLLAKYEDLPLFDKDEFTSANTEQLSETELTKLLEKEKWLWK